MTPEEQATWKVTLAYVGTDFSGWARQPGLRTVQETVERAIGQILGGLPVSLSVAGRTDAGVHALAQVASFVLGAQPPDNLARRINAVLPRDVAVLACEEAPDGFDARRWATSRRYRYRILTSPQRNPFEEERALWWPYPLDRDAIEACAAELPGEHDFTAFTPTQTEHVRFRRRILSASWEAEREDILAFRVEADAFMRNMIRILVGTMLEVAQGKRSVEDFRSLLEGAPRERAGETSPACGLYFAGAEFGSGPAFEH